jgi:hypothetical protein
MTMTNGKPHRWYDDERRHCLGDISYSEADGRQQREVERMIYGCLTCPVIIQCHHDAQTNPHRHGTVQGGELW